MNNLSVQTLHTQVSRKRKKKVQLFEIALRKKKERKKSQWWNSASLHVWVPLIIHMRDVDRKWSDSWVHNGNVKGGLRAGRKEPRCAVTVWRTWTKIHIPLLIYSLTDQIHNQNCLQSFFNLKTQRRLARLHWKYLLITFWEPAVSETGGLWRTVTFKSHSFTFPVGTKWCKPVEGCLKQHYFCMTFQMATKRMTAKCHTLKVGMVKWRCLELWADSSGWMLLNILLDVKMIPWKEHEVLPRGQNTLWLFKTQTLKSQACFILEHRNQITQKLRIWFVCFFLSLVSLYSL